MSYIIIVLRHSFGMMTNFVRTIFIQLCY